MLSHRAKPKQCTRTRPVVNMFVKSLQSYDSEAAPWQLLQQLGVNDSMTRASATEMHMTWVTWDGEQHIAESYLTEAGSSRVLLLDLVLPIPGAAAENKAGNTSDLLRFSLLCFLFVNLFLLNPLPCLCHKGVKDDGFRAEIADMLRRRRTFVNSHLC